jgi:plastocyanin
MLSAPSFLARRARRLGAAGLVALAALAPAALPSPVAAATHAVEIGDGFFGPAALTVAVGDAVTWTNADDSPHTVTADGAFDSGNLDPGAAFSFTFTEAGTYTYVCRYHDEMVATITVVASGSGGSTATPAPAAPAGPAGTPASGQTAGDTVHDAATAGQPDAGQPDTALPIDGGVELPAWLAPLLIGLGLMAFAVAAAPSLPFSRRDTLAAESTRRPGGGWRR